MTSLVFQSLREKNFAVLNANKIHVPVQLPTKYSVSIKLQKTENVLAELHSHSDEEVDGVQSQEHSICATDKDMLLIFVLNCNSTSDLLAI